MKTNEKSTVTATPNEPGENTNTENNPKKPGNDPDQTPEKETQTPPVAKPGQEEPSKPGKIGFDYGK